MKKLLLVFAFVAISVAVASSSTLTWVKTFGSGGEERIYDLCEAQDGYILAGTTKDVNSEDLDVWVLKVNEKGDLVWQKAFGSEMSDNAKAIDCSDGVFVVGETSSVGNGDMLLLKLDSNGNLVWQKAYGGPSWDGGQSLVPTPDGGYFVAGFSESFGAGYEDAWVVKYDKDGKIEWQKTIGGKDMDVANSADVTEDGGYVVAGLTAVNRSVAGWVVKLDKDGRVEWQKAYSGGQWVEFDSIKQTSDGGYVAVGYLAPSGLFSMDALIVKINSTGDIEWAKAYGGADEDRAHAVVETSDGYIVGGYVTLGGHLMGWLMKLDKDGNEVWQRVYNGYSKSWISEIDETADYGILAAGYSEFLIGRGDAWVLKTDKNGIVNNFDYLLRTRVDGEDVRLGVNTTDAIETDANGVEREIQLVSREVPLIKGVYIIAPLGLVGIVGMYYYVRKKSDAKAKKRSKK